MSKQINEQDMLRGGLMLAENKWGKKIRVIEENMKKSGKRGMSKNMKAALACSLENTRDYIKGGQINEVTTSAEVGAFTHYAFDVISAVMVNLIAEEIVSVQPMEKRIAEVFFLDYKYGTPKGAFGSGDVMIGAKTGAVYDKGTNYSSETVENEALGTGAPPQTHFTRTSDFLPIIPSTVVITDNDEVIVDNGQNVLVTQGTTTVRGSVDYTLGTIDVTFATAPSAVQVNLTYKTSFETNTNNIPEVDISVRSEVVEAMTRKLRTNWLLDAAYDLMKAHGRDMALDVLTATTSEIRHEIDGQILNELYNAAYIDIPSFDATAVTAISRRERLGDIRINLNAGSNAIFKATKRGQGNIIIGGLNVNALLQSLVGFDKATPNEGEMPSGPHFSGTLDGRWKCYANPFYPDNEYVMAFKGTSYLNSAFVYAPYLPLFVTNPVMLDDLTWRRGLATKYGTKLINAGMLAKGEITSF